MTTGKKRRIMEARMLQLYVFRNNLKFFYAKYSLIIDSIIKFILVLASLMLININLGYQTGIKSPIWALAIALVSAFFPYRANVFFVAIFLITHIFSASFELALLIGIMFVLVLLLYYSFNHGDGSLILLVPLLFALKIPYVIPLIMGLAGSLLSIIPVSVGILIYFICLYARQNIGTLTKTQSVDIAQRYSQTINGVFSNKTMLLLIIAFAFTVLVVYYIHRLSIDYSWQIAIAVGAIVLLVIVFVGDYILDISIPFFEFVLGLLASIFISYIYNFFVFSVDYTRTEYTQFEDDDYYYYVKAVPKITVTAADKKVQSFTPKGRKKVKNNGGSE